MTAKPDLEVILPVDGIVEVDGIRARVKRLKTREFLGLLRVITTGMGPAMAQVKLTADDPDQLQAEMMGLFLVAVPNAIDEFSAFMVTIVEAETPKNQPQLLKAMDNPDPGVLLDVLTIMAEQEKDDLAVLAGKARAAVTRIQTVYQAAG